MRFQGVIFPRNLSSRGMMVWGNRAAGWVHRAVNGGRIAVCSSVLYGSGR